MKQKTIKTAFIKTIPVMAGYLVLGIGFGITLENNGYGICWALAMSGKEEALYDICADR